MGRLPRISTDRLSLRPFTIMDIDRLHALWTQPDMRRFLWDDVIISRDRAADEVERGLQNAGRHGIGYWVIESQKENDLLDFCGFRLIDHEPEIELMYGLGRAYWGKGLTTEASRAALAWLWNSTGYSRVYEKRSCTSPYDSADCGYGTADISIPAAQRRQNIPVLCRVCASP